MDHLRLAKAVDMGIRIVAVAALSTMIGLNGCALKIGHVDPSALPYVERFKKEATARGVFADVGFIDVEVVESFDGFGVSRDTVGVCFSNGNPDSGKISLLASFWASAPDSAKENLMFHELGHCALSLGHLDCPRGANQIMCPTMLPNLYYQTQRTALIDELFHE